MVMNGYVYGYLPAFASEFVSDYVPAADRVAWRWVSFIRSQGRIFVRGCYFRLHPMLVLSPRNPRTQSYRVTSDLGTSHS